jgi:bifunctional DNA-binding transcriptional regulator/antitoxin component of YhaV-PrlF toxin-antitoxin module
MSTRVKSKAQVTIRKRLRERLGIRPGGAKRKPGRFAALRGTATVRMSTRQIMALTRGED